MTLRLGVNIDHIATLRNARGGQHPDPARGAMLAEQAGADGITIHLREDRRHIRDGDVSAIMQAISIRLNFEMAATEEMQAIALQANPHAVCLVPEKREELTTEGGLDVAGQQARLAEFIAPLAEAGMRVSLFIDPDAAQLQASKAAGAAVVELHTGRYAEVTGEEQQQELVRLQRAAQLTETLGLECHAGHGLTYDNVGPVAAIPQIVELNIGHFLMGEAVFTGLEAAIGEMRRKMNEARA